MAEDADLVLLATVLGHILDGDRAPDLAAPLTDPTQKAIVATVLQHISPG
jgi:hypothetical protein